MWRAHPPNGCHTANPAAEHCDAVKWGLSKVCRQLWNMVHPVNGCQEVRNERQRMISKLGKRPEEVGSLLVVHGAQPVLQVPALICVLAHLQKGVPTLLSARPAEMQSAALAPAPAVMQRAVPCPLQHWCRASSSNSARLQQQSSWCHPIAAVHVDPKGVSPGPTCSIGAKRP